MSHLVSLAFSMAPNEDPDTSDTRVSSHPPSDAPSDPSVCSDSQQQQTDDTSAFSHPGARVIAQIATDGDGPYRCRKCGDAVLTVSVKQCPACLDNHPWFSPPPDDEEPV